MPVIHRIETHERGEQAPVGLGNEVAEQITLPPQPLLGPVESLENPLRGRLVGGLCRGESRAVDTIVDGVVNAGVHLVDLVRQRVRIEVRQFVSEFVKLGIQHPDDVG